MSTNKTNQSTERSNTHVTSKSKRRSSKGKQSNTTSKETRSKLSVEDSRLSDRDRDNDPNWYFTSSDLASQAGELSIQEVLGNGPVIQEAGVPTCAVVYLNPSPGVSYSFTGNENNIAGWRKEDVPVSEEVLPESAVVNDGANLMAFKMYTLMSSFTGRTQSYGPQDLLIMILSISQVAAISEHIRRIFGMALTVNARNRALPKGMLEAMGVMPDDFIAHLADYRMQFNVQMTRINQVPLLDNVGFIRKCRDIYQKVYVDTDSPMGQNWFFAPYSTWVLDEQSSPQGGFLKTVNCPYGATYMRDWLSLLTSMIDAILSSSTMQIVYSDLINLANKVNVPTWQFDYLAENYVVLPEYNRNAQLQLHNLDVVGGPISLDQWKPTSTDFVGTITNSNDVIQDPDNNRILYNPGFFASDGSATSATGTVHLLTVPHDTIVDFDTPNPTLEDRIEALRFSFIQSTYRMRIKRPDVNEWGVITFGGTLSDHYVVRVDVKEYPNNGTYISRSDQRDTSNSLTEHLTYFDKLANAPLLYIVGASRTSIVDRRCVKTIGGDLNFFTKVPYEYLQRTNRLMYTGLFDFRV